jgi:hypothetical protein
MCIVTATAVSSGAQPDQPVSGEISVGIKGISFKDSGPTKSFFSLETGSRSNNVGVFLSLGAANIENNMKESASNTYRESVNFYPLELNVKGFIPYKNVELGAGVGLSMNFLDYALTNETTNKTINSETNVLFGSQAMAEIKFLFPSTSGKDAFIGLEYCYQYVQKANTFLGDKDFSNYRIGIKLGGRF